MDTNQISLPPEDIVSIPPFPFEKKLKTYLKKANVKIEKKDVTSIDENIVREGFFKILLKLLQKYKNYLITPTENNKKAEIFDKEAFISHSDNSVKVFLSRWVESQSFQRFFFETKLFFLKIFFLVLLKNVFIQKLYHTHYNFLKKA